MTTPTKEDIRDEARRRVAVVLGTRYGADLNQAAVMLALEHALEPRLESMQAISAVVQIQRACRCLEVARPVDYRSDAYWTVLPVALPVEVETALLPSPLDVVRSEALMRLEGMRGGILDALIKAARVAQAGEQAVSREDIEARVRSDPDAARRLVAIDDAIKAALTFVRAAGTEADIGRGVHAAEIAIANIMALEVA